jgi:hypothetical protein
MDPFIVVTHPSLVSIQARQVDSDRVPEDHIAIAFYSGEHLVARSAVPPNAVEPLRQLLSRPVTLALAAKQDDDGNIDGRVCIVLPMPEGSDDDEEPDEPWKSSIPQPPPGIESGDEPDAHSPRLALMPLGNVIRPAKNRRHADVESDAREMLDNLLMGRASDAVSRAIDDLLDSI